jgi:hypothetical protein
MTDQPEPPPDRIYIERWPEEPERDDRIHYEQTGYGVDMHTGATSEIHVYLREDLVGASKSALLQPFLDLAKELEREALTRPREAPPFVPRRRSGHQDKHCTEAPLRNHRSGRGEERMTGIERIAAERKRQIEKEGFTAKHDADEYHENGELAWAAVCYAAPKTIYTMDGALHHVRFDDPWPEFWDDDWDKRPRTLGGERLLDNRELPHDLRIRQLEKAGALIAAEIDRLLRVKEEADG